MYGPMTLVFWKQKWWSTWYKCTIIARKKAVLGNLVSCIVMTFYIQSNWAIPWKSLLSLRTEALEPLQDTDMIVVEISPVRGRTCWHLHHQSKVPTSHCMSDFFILWKLFSHHKYPFRDMTVLTSLATLLVTV